MRTLPLIGAVLVASLFESQLAAAASDIARGREQFVAFYLGTPAAPGGNITFKSSNELSPDVARATQFVQSLQSDGHWSDLDYASKAHSGWPPDTHWTRVLAILAAAHSPGAAIDHARFDAAVHRAIGYWIGHDFICPNWWYNEIGVPQQAATAALLLGDSLTADEKRYMINTLMPRAKIGMTGQNRVWLAGNTLMFGLVEGNETAVSQAAGTIWREVAVTTAEGIQPDFSFHQHGPQQQFGNYGMALAVEICRWANVLRGTPWAMPPDRLATYRDFLLDGEAWVVWRGYMDVSACNRQLMPHAQAAKARTIERVMRNTAPFDPTHASAYSDFVRRNSDIAAPNDLLGNRVFWRSDYVVHRRPDFAATLKLSSRRVVGAEMVNHENLSGYHEADGALYLYHRGDEYVDIFPVWDWQKLPGVTCAQGAGGPPSFEHVRGERDFTGGVTDGLNGCAVLDFARDGVTAHKAWFFADNAIVCLGADIHPAGANPVVTTLNQCLRHGPVTVKRAGREPAVFAGGEESLGEVEWVEHDGWRYGFPMPTAIHLRAAPQTGNWNRVFTNPDTPRAEVAHDVFALWVDHAAANSSYAYTVTSAGLNAPTVIVTNTASIQAVWLSSTKAAIAFWSPGDLQLTPTLRIRADGACTVMVDLAAQRLFVADPTQNLAHLTIATNGSGHRISLPRDGDAGRTVSVDFK